MYDEREHAKAVPRKHEAIGCESLSADQGHEDPWLIRKHALTTLTSMGSPRLRGAKPLASRARIAFAGIGNPVLTGAPGTFRAIELGQTVLAAGRIDIEALRRLPSLPETATEIEPLGGR